MKNGFGGLHNERFAGDGILFKLIGNVSMSTRFPKTALKKIPFGNPKGIFLQISSS
ncbi:MAG: hypothetical protein KDI06_15715 [Calditrichaeota bacterium]|nr:hypothetical protein [Calditrichota bacterium]HQU74697.1 hypothetical protein [Calditrichia bacterium]